MQKVTIKEKNELEELFLSICKKDKKHRNIYNFIIKKLVYKKPLSQNRSF